MSTDMDDEILGDPGRSAPHGSSSMSRSPSPSRPIAASRESPAPSVFQDALESRSPLGALPRSPSPTSTGAPSPHSSRSRSSSRGSAQPTGESDEDSYDDPEDGYERRRLENMRANDQYMASLSLKSASAMFASPPAVAGPSKPRNRPKPRVLRDRNGYILTQPEPGKKHILACIEIPPDRRVQRLIAEGAYKDYTLLGRGEARRWRFGDGTGVLAEGEEPGEVDGVSDTFRWRPWDESESEDEPEDSPKVVPPTPEPREKKPKVHYSELSGATCHQCKRKSDKAKMRCRNPGCDREYCTTCCSRYDFEFDEDNRSWICPFCMDNCNCGACRKKQGREPLGFSAFGRTAARVEADRQGVKLQTFLEKSEAPRKPTFDRIRLVNRDTDIISPPLPRAWQEYLAELEKPKPKVLPSKKRKIIVGARGKGGKGKGGKGGRGKGGKGKVAEEEVPTAPDSSSRAQQPAPSIEETPTPATPATTTAPITLRIPMHRLPPPPPKAPIQERDSDDETIHGFSDEEIVPPPSNRQVRQSRSMSSNASDRFVSQNGREQPSTNEFLARQFGGVAPEPEPEPEPESDPEHSSEVFPAPDAPPPPDVFPPREDFPPQDAFPPRDVFPPPELFEERGPLVGTGDMMLAAPPLSEVETADPQNLILGPWPPVTPLTPQTDRRTPVTPGGMPLEPLFMPFSFQTSPPMRTLEEGSSRNGRKDNGKHEIGGLLEYNDDTHGHNLGLGSSRSPSVRNDTSQHNEYPPPSYFSPPKHAAPLTHGTRLPTSSPRRRPPPPSAHIVRHPKHVREQRVGPSYQPEDAAPSHAHAHQHATIPQADTNGYLHPFAPSHTHTHSLSHNPAHSGLSPPYPIDLPPNWWAGSSTEKAPEPPQPQQHELPHHPHHWWS